MPSKRSREIIAVVTTDKKWIGGGKAQTFIAENDEQCLTFTRELARSLQGEVVAMSNGIYLILEM